MSTSNYETDSFINVQLWMRDELDLNGAELLIYALIRGYSNGPNQYCTCDQEYIAHWCGVSSRQVRKLIAVLEEKGLVVKETLTPDFKSAPRYRYKAIRPKKQSQEEVETLPEQSSGGVNDHRNKVPVTGGTKFRLSPEQSSGTTSNNINNNINNNIIKENIKRNSEPDEFEELWKLYPRKEGKKDAYAAYKKAIRNGTTNQEIRQGIENYKAWLKAKNETTYIKQGSTFFKGEHWTNEYDLTTINRGDPFDIRNQYWDENDPTVH